jgi:hypothetical protein
MILKINYVDRNNVTYINNIGNVIFDSKEKKVIYSTDNKHTSYQIVNEDNERIDVSLIDCGKELQTLDLKKGRGKL